MEVISFQFMEQEGASSLLQFWLTAENFYNQLSGRSEHSSANMEADVADAMTIYDRLNLCSNRVHSSHPVGFTCGVCMLSPWIYAACL